jgi:hypothetical protein
MNYEIKYSSPYWYIYLGEKEIYKSRYYHDVQNEINRLEKEVENNDAS